VKGGDVSPGHEAPALPRQQHGAGGAFRGDPAAGVGQGIGQFLADRVEAQGPVEAQMRHQAVAFQFHW